MMHFGIQKDTWRSWYIYILYFILCNISCHEVKKLKRRTCHLAIWFVSPFFQTLRTPQNVFVLKFCRLGFCSKLFQHSASNDVRYSGFWTAKQWQGRFFCSSTGWYNGRICVVVLMVCLLDESLRYVIMMVIFSGKVFYLIWLHIVFGWFPRWRFLVDKCDAGKRFAYSSSSGHKSQCCVFEHVASLRFECENVANEIQNSRCHHLHQNCWGQVTCKKYAKVVIYMSAMKNPLLFRVYRGLY